MPDDFAKLWLQQNLNANAINRALQAIQSTGRALPCTVVATNVDGFASLVTVNFEAQVPYTTPQGDTAYFTLPPMTIPKAESQWLRSPTQVGDVGMTVPADTILGGVSGVGSGVAQLGTEYGNLSCLVFVPIAATSFSTAPTDKAWANGPKGARIGDSASGVYVDADVTSGTVTIFASGKSWTFGPAGFTMSTGIVAETHVHPGVTSGSDPTGEPEA